MTRKDIENALRSQTTGDFITRQEIANALGFKDAHSIDRYTNGLVRIGRRYFIKEVAEIIAKSVR